MGPPPPPPPPPPPSLLAPRGRTPASVPRRDHNPLPAAPAKTRPSLDAAALQHAAANLRKTVDGEQIRSDSQDLSDGRLAGQNQQLSGRDRPLCQEQRPLGGHQPYEQVYATPSRSVPSRPLGHHYGGHADTVDGRSAPSAPPQTQFKTFNAPTVTIQPPSEPSVYSNIQQSTSSQYSVPSQSPRYSANQYSPVNQYQSSNQYSSSQYSQPVSTRNVTITKTYTYETPSAPGHSSVHSSSHSSSQNSAVPSANSNYVTERTTQNANYANISPVRSSQSSVGRHSPNNNYNTPRSHSPYITDARSRIHEFATTTPAGSVASGNGYQSSAHSSEYSSIRRSPQSVRSPSDDFAKQLRDQARSTLISLLPIGGLTERQKYANQFQKSTTRDSNLPFSAENIYKESFRDDAVDHLVQQMNFRLASGGARSATNVCVACKGEITNDKPGCTAMDSIYHVACFKCKRCGCTLAGSSFYNVDGDPVCDKDYQDSLERCTKCGQAIADKLLRACGGTFHVNCFSCTVCNICLDGVPFTVDPENQVHCVPCYHNRYAPRCAVCSAAIVPRDGEKESVRVVAMDKSFHVDCYRCEDCGLQLSSKVEGQGCYPIDQHLFCKTCNSNRLRLQSSA